MFITIITLSISIGCNIKHSHTECDKNIFKAIHKEAWNFPF